MFSAPCLVHPPSSRALRSQLFCWARLCPCCGALGGSMGTPNVLQEHPASLPGASCIPSFQSCTCGLGVFPAGVSPLVPLNLCGCSEPSQTLLPHLLLALVLSTCAHVVACHLHFHLTSFDWEELKPFHLDCSIFSHQVSTAPTPQPYKLRNQVGVSC